MSVIRTKNKTHFVQIANATLRQPTLSLKAKGLLALMLTYQDDWKYNLPHLARQSSDGMHATRAAFNELRKAGHVTRHQTRSEAGRITGYEYVVTEEAVVQKPDAGDSAPGDVNTRKPDTTNNDSTKPEAMNTEHASDARSGSVRPVPSAMSASPTIVSADAFLECWNDERGELPAARALNPGRRREIAALRKDNGQDALATFRAAVKAVAADPFWVARQYGLDTLLKRGRVQEKAEKHHAAQEAAAPRPKREPPSFLEVGQPVLLPNGDQGILLAIVGDRFGEVDGTGYYWEELRPIPEDAP